MKKISFLFVICAFAFQLNAQDSLRGIKASIGLMFNPQGVISLETPSVGFNVVTPLLVAASISKGHMSVTPIYIINSNSFGGFLKYSSKKFGIYGIAVKATQVKDFYVGLGATTPAIKNWVDMLFEVGTSAYEWDPKLTIGICIPFMLPLNKIKKSPKPLSP